MDHSSLKTTERSSVLFKEECQGPSCKNSNIYTSDKRKEGLKTGLNKDWGQEKKAF